MVEAFDVRPVSLRADSPVMSRTESHVAIECFGKDLVEIFLVVGDSRAVREDDSKARSCGSCAGRIDDIRASDAPVCGRP